jgi:hypothetical protein
MYPSHNQRLLRANAYKYKLYLTKKTMTTKNYFCPIDQMPTLLTASEIARLANVHQNTIRNWCNKGVLRHVTRTENGERLFCVMAVAEARNIRRQPRPGLGLGE